MHGVKRAPKTAASAEARAARKAKEASKLQSYLDIERTFFTYKRESRKDLTALHHTTTLLTLNPELYTVWNYRREILLHIFGAAVETASKDKGKDVFASLRTDVSASGDSEDSDEEERRRIRNSELLEDDLTLTEHALRANPKVYWIWNHRMWCLTQYPPPSASTSRAEDMQWVWNRELKLVEKMLDYDPRNFHGWNCRRAIVHHLALSILPDHVVSTQPSFPAVLSHPDIASSDTASSPKKELLALAETELAYALRKIESNFSNFSAWHQRTKLLPHLWTAQQLTQPQIDLRIDTELELVKQAMYTDPSDQSVWFYHRWLIDQVTEGKQEETSKRKVKVLEEEVATIEELFELEPESKWCAISLAHLHTLLAEVKGAEEGSGKAKELLEKLIELDPDREARYKDLLEGKARF